MRGGNHKQQQHAIYVGEADTKYKVGGHVCSAGGNYHGSVNVISQARNKPHQFRMVLLNSARCCSIPNNIVQFHIVWSMKQWNPRHRLTHTCVIVSSIIRCGVDSSCGWLAKLLILTDDIILQACDSCFVIHATKPLRESHHWSDCVVDKMAILSLLCSNGSRVRDNFLKTRMVEVRDESSDWS